MNTSSKMPPEVIALAGTLSSGKDTYAEHLRESFGYRHASTGDLIRAEALKRYGSIERPVLVKTGTELRIEHGAGSLAKLALEGEKPVVVTGVRTLGEVAVIRSAGGLVVFIDAPIEKRYEWMRARRRDQEVNLSLEEFRQRDQREWYAGPDAADYNLRDIKKEADIVVENGDMTLEQFITRLDTLLNIQQ